MGIFTISNLAPGEYRIEAEHAGFRKHVQPINVQLNQDMQIEIPLLAGQRTESVEVTAVTTPVQTASSENSHMVDFEQMAHVTVRGRDLMSLLQTVPGNAAGLLV